MRRAAYLGMILVCISSYAQTAPHRPQFDVASVRPAVSDELGVGRLSTVMREVIRNRRQPGEIPMTSPDRMRLQDWTLLDLIAAAYSVRPNQVSGPAWLDDQGFDIEAKVPDGTPKEALNAMLQSLLAERFGLAAHRATSVERGYALVIGKDGPRLKPAVPPAPAQGPTEEAQKALAEQKFQQDAAARRNRAEESLSQCPSGFNTQGWSSVTTEEFAPQLMQFTHSPVTDETGLTGKYSINIQMCKNADEPGGTVFDAVEKLGLKLEPRKLTIETVVVDHVSKTPTAN